MKIFENSKNNLLLHTIMQSMFKNRMQKTHVKFAIVKTFGF